MSTHFVRVTRERTGTPAPAIINVKKIVAVEPHPNGGSLVSFDNGEQPWHVTEDYKDLSDRITEQGRKAGKQDVNLVDHVHHRP